jgi:hypothetical protein
MTAFFRQNGRGILLIVATYFYFLIFAQFALVELLNADLEGGLKPMMAAMALSGIAGSLAAPFLLAKLGGKRTLFAGLVCCAFMGIVAVPVHHFWGYLFVAIGTGLSLGVLTVSLTAQLPSLLGATSWGSGIGVGTGMAYAMSNLPAVFATSPGNQALISAGVVLSGLFALIGRSGNVEECAESPRSILSFFPFAVLVFLALVWLDSAAFFIIQHTRGMKESSWGDVYLWRNGAVHLAFAILAGWWLQRRSAAMITGMAFVILAVASLCLNEAQLGYVGGLIYPAGVSLYSTALVACPAFLARFALPGRGQPVAWSAAVLYSIAGWFGSANGIGMAENLQEIPVLFLLIAAVVFLMPKLWLVVKKRRVESSLCVVVIAVIIATRFGLGQAEEGGSSLARGQEVYLAEGCIHCHSRYVRPASDDVVKWGPVVPLEEILTEAPVLIGNRRSGPDLLNVGNRRSRAWLKQHFIDPQSLSPGSPMPSYAHLFDDGRGEDLLDYLVARGLENFSERYEMIENWEVRPAGEIPEGRGRELFSQHCASCHGASGQGDGRLGGLWVRRPANLVNGPFTHSLDHSRIEKIVKFGILGTDMPGHENLSDTEVVALANFLRDLR